MAHKGCWCVDEVDATHGLTLGPPSRKKSELHGETPLENLNFFAATLSSANIRGKQAIRSDEYGNIFLTGATGFVGRLLLVSLLHNTKANVYCLVRAFSIEEGTNRIKDALEEARIWHDSWARRIHVVLGDLTDAQLGLSPSKWKSLSAGIDAVYHCAASTSLDKSYNSLRLTNVASLATIVDFCKNDRLKPLFYISSIEKFWGLECDKPYEGNIFSENSRLNLADLEKRSPPGIYGLAWSKLVCEEALRVAFDCGLPGAVFRLPNLWLAKTEYGFGDVKSLGTVLLAGCVQEAVFPVGFFNSWLTSANHACDLVVELSTTPGLHHKFYHVLNRRVAKTSEIVNWGSALGLIWGGVTWTEFEAIIRRRGRSSPVYSWLPLLSSLQDSKAGDWADDESSPKLPVSDSHAWEDCPSFVWPDVESVFRSSFVFLSQRRVFPKDTKAFKITIDFVYEQAKRLSGLSDLGSDPDFYLDAFDKFFTGLRTELDASFAAKLCAVRGVKQYLANVMYMVEMSKVTPGIEKATVTEPVFIVGLNRSGTTFLHNLMCQDRDTRYPTLSEMQVPYGADGSYRPVNVPIDASWENDPRADVCREIQNQQMTLNREFMSMHLRRAVNAEEDFLMLEHSGRSFSYLVGFPSETYREWLTADDYAELKRGYGLHKRFMQHLQHQRPATSRWCLKMPFHLLCLSTVFETYPNAKIIFAHREPVAVLTSWCKLEALVQNHLLDSRDSKRLGKMGLDSLSLMLKKTVGFRKENPQLAPQFYDLSYEDLITDPVAAVRNIYDYFGWNFSKQTTNRVWKYIFDNRSLRPLVDKEAAAARRETARLLEVTMNNDSKCITRSGSDTNSGDTTASEHGFDMPSLDEATESKAREEENDNPKLAAAPEVLSGKQLPNVFADDAVSPLERAGITRDMVNEAFEDLTLWTLSKGGSPLPWCGRRNVILDKFKTTLSLVSYMWGGNS